MRQRNIKKYLLEYNEFLESKGYSPRTIVSAITITRTFYKEFDIQLPNQKLNRKYRQETIDDLPSIDEIRKATESFQYQIQGYNNVNVIVRNEKC